MKQRVTHREVPEAHRASEHLDNERTFLAWVRTNIALISLGFVVARLSPSIGAVAGANVRGIETKAVPVGISLVVLGAIVTVLAAWRYDRVNRQIEEGRVTPDRGMVWIVTLVIALLSAAAVAYMLLAR
jgi:inner membrane protein YidH